MSAGCPLCGASVAQLDLSGIRFLARVNKTAAILRLLRDVAQGLTWEEIARVTKFSHATVSARLHDLQGRNEIVAHGKRRTQSGRLATVFRVVNPENRDTAQLDAEAA